MNRIVSLAISSFVLSSLIGAGGWGVKECWPASDQAIMAQHASGAREQKVPRYKPKPGISDSVPFAYKLPNKLIDQQKSPDKQYVAQVMYAEPGPVYFLAIIDRKRARRFFLDEQLITGKEYPFNAIRVRWKDVDTIVVEAVHQNGRKKLLLEYNNTTAKLSRAEQTIESKPQPPLTMLPETLMPVRLSTLDERMFLHKQIPIGVTYEALKNNLPGLGPLKSDAGRNLTEAFLDIDVLGYQAQVEFNFKDRTLYGFYYIMQPMNSEKANVVYKKLTGYYSMHFGQHREEFVQEEPGYAVRQAIWETENAFATVVNNITHGGVTITWSVKDKNR